MATEAMRADWSRTYRVAQWATGNVGARALRRVIEHPGLELVGVWVHGGDKVGRDAGDLAGVAPVGIAATDSGDAIIALRPDCVLYMPHVCQVDDICRILESGANIVTTRMEFQNPAGLDPADRARVEAACRRGGTSIHATGSSPGFVSEALPIVLTSLARRLDRIVIHEFADTSGRNSPEMLFGPMMGFAAPPGQVNEGMMQHMKASFSPSLGLIADAVGLPFDEISVRGEQGIARADVTIPAGLVPKGTVAATRTIVSGSRAGKPVIEFVATWYVSSDVDTSDGQSWDFRRSGWRILVEGDTPLDVTIGFPVPQADFDDFTPNLTAHRPVNCIPYVCAAPPGIVTTLDLPQVVARLG